MPHEAQFRQDRQGRSYGDVFADSRINFSAILTFLDTADCERRLIESEIHHDRPALAGVIRELEAMPDVHDFFRTNDGHTTMRFRQAVGVAVGLLMKKNGWETTGNQALLGTRADVPPRTTIPGAYHNISGLALWFSSAERYTPPTDPQYPQYQTVEVRAAALAQPALTPTASGTVQSTIPPNAGTNP